MLIFPHESAVVTNTCSCRKDSFSYGFFSVATCVGSDVSFTLIEILSNSHYWSADWEACTAHPPVPPDPHN
jgi:hypothetical protein